jgi:hypothetical protein
LFFSHFSAIDRAQQGEGKVNEGSRCDMSECSVVHSLARLLEEGGGELTDVDARPADRRVFRTFPVSHPRFQERDLRAVSRGYAGCSDAPGPAPDHDQVVVVARVVDVRRGGRGGAETMDGGGGRTMIAVDAGKGGVGGEEVAVT